MRELSAVVVIGLGSMGRRRIRLLKKYGGEKIEIIGIDKREDRRTAVGSEYSITTFDDLASAVDKYAPKAAFVCTSPDSHSGIIIECLKCGINVFSELNLVSNGYDEIISFAKEKGLVVFLSSTLLYRRETEYIYKKIHDCKEQVNYLYHCGQYLPDWHPWENYKDVFFAKKSTNGCREFMAIEFPWIRRVFGEVESVDVLYGKHTTLDISFPDNYMIMLKHTNGNKGTILIDVVAKIPVRNLEITGDNIQILWDGTPYGLKDANIKEKKYDNIFLYDEIDKEAGYNESIIEDAYYEEIVEFFGVLNGDIEEPRYSFESDKITIQLMDKVEGEEKDEQ